MADEDENLEPAAKRSRMELCATCSAEEGKYRCPGCNRCSCSLRCVQQHKRETECEGVRDVAAFVPLHKMDDSLLRNDYQFLENCTRTAVSAARIRHELKLDDRAAKISKLKPRKGKRKQIDRAPESAVPTAAADGFSSRVALLVKAAQDRNIKLEIVAEGMQRRKKNISFYHVKKSLLSWCIEWLLPELPDVSFRLANCPEDSTPLQVISKFFNTDSANTVLSHKLLRLYPEGPSGVIFLIKSTRAPANAPCYYQLPANMTFKESLSGLRIVEYPTVLLVTAASLKSYNVVAKRDEVADMVRELHVAENGNEEEDDEEEEDEEDEEEEEEEEEEEDLGVHSLLQDPAFVQASLLEIQALAGIEPDL